VKKQKNYPFNKIKQFNSFREMLDTAASEAGERPAILYKDAESGIGRVSYRELRFDVNSLGTALTSLELISKHIACIGGNRYESITAFLSVLCGNGVFVPIDTELSASETVDILRHSDSEVLFYDGVYEQIIKENLDKLDNIVCFIGFDREKSSEDGRFLSYSRLIGSGRLLYADGDLSYSELESDAMALRLLCYTVRNDGVRNGVMLSEHNLASAVCGMLRSAKLYDRCLAVLPLHDPRGLICCLLASLHTHAAICLYDKRRSLSKNLRMYKPSYIFLDSSVVDSLCKRIRSNIKKTEKYGQVDKRTAFSAQLRTVGIDMRSSLFEFIHKSFGGRLKKIICIGAPLRPDTAEFFDSVGIPVTTGYGIPECSSLASINRDRFADGTTAGTALPCCEIRISDPDSEGIGEICIKGDNVMIGYYKDAASTADAVRGGRLFTGDLGMLDEDGRLRIVDDIR